MSCQNTGKPTCYIGETGKSIFERGKQHLADALSKKRRDKSHIAVHIRDEHNGDPTKANFQFKVLRKFKTAFSRQIAEAVEIRIRTRKGEHLLNNKQEFSRCVLPELEVTMADKLVSKKVAEEIREEVKNVGEKNDDDETVGPKKRSNTHTYDQNNKRRKINPKSDGAGGENQRLHGWGTGSGSITKPHVGPLAPHPCSQQPKPAFGNKESQTPYKKIQNLGTGGKTKDCTGGTQAVGA